MVRLELKNTPQKCWYCKKNPADKESLNVEEVNKDKVEIKGFYKVKHKSTKSYNVVRCKECLRIHRKSDSYATFLFYLFFVFSFICMCFFYNTNGFLDYFIAFVISLITSVIFLNLMKFIIGYIFAIKYKTKPEWARGGFF